MTCWGHFTFSSLTFHSYLHPFMPLKQLCLFLTSCLSEIFSQNLNAWFWQLWSSYCKVFFRALLCFIVLTLHFLSREQVTALSPRNFHNFSEGERKVFLVLCWICKMGSFISLVLNHTSRNKIMCFELWVCSWQVCSMLRYSFSGQKVTLLHQTFSGKLISKPNRNFMSHFTDFDH